MKKDNGGANVLKDISGQGVLNGKRSEDVRDIFHVGPQHIN